MLIWVAYQLRITMTAGERHSKNYHAWEYARQVSRLLFPVKPVKGRGIADVKNSCHSNILRQSFAITHQWCLMHPTDISGWAFLASQLFEFPDQTIAVQEASKVIGNTRDFVRKFDWKGESVCWFLRTMEGKNLYAQARVST